MNKVIPLLLLGALSLGLLTAAVAQEPALQLQVLPDKLRYDPGETAVFTATVKPAAAAVSGRLSARVLWEMEDSKALGEAAVQVAPGTEGQYTFKWEKLPEVLGCEIRVELKDPAGKLLAADSDYFNVIKTRDTCRVGIHGVAIGLITTSDPAYLATLPGIAETHARHYTNIGEYFLSESSTYDLVLKQDEIMGGAYWNSATAVKQALDAYRRYGCKGVLYVTSYTSHGLADLEYSLKHPEWLFFDKLGQPANAGVDVAQEDKVRFPEWRKHLWPGPFASCSVNWTVPEVLDQHIDSLIANRTAYGMDGVRYDGHPGTQWGDFDVFGKPVITGEARTQTAIRIAERIRQRVTAKHPDYLFLWNTGPAMGVGAVIDLVSGKLDPALLPCVRDGGALCDEEHRGAYAAGNRFHAWKDHADCVVSDVDLVRPVGGHAYILFPWTSTLHKNSDEIGYSLMLAAGAHPWFSSSAEDRATDPGGSHYPIQRELFAFATRFSSLLWGHGIERVKDPDGLVDVKSDQGEIWWRNYVHQRKLADGRRYVTVHLLNAPPNKEMGVVEQPLPDPLQNVRVIFKQPVKKAWVCTARPGPGRVVVRDKATKNWWEADSHEEFGPVAYGPAEVKNGQVVVPNLRMWTMVVAEMG